MKSVMRVPSVPWVDPSFRHHRSGLASPSVHCPWQMRKGKEWVIPSRGGVGCPDAGKFYSGLKKSFLVQLTVGGGTDSSRGRTFVFYNSSPHYYCVTQSVLERVVSPRDGSGSNECRPGSGRFFAAQVGSAI